MASKPAHPHREGPQAGGACFLQPRPGEPSMLARPSQRMSEALGEPLPQGVSSSAHFLMLILPSSWSDFAFPEAK